MTAKTVIVVCFRTGFVSGVLLNKKERDLFRQELDDIFKLIEPRDPMLLNLIIQPIFYPVVRHPKVDKEVNDRDASIIEVGVNPNNQSGLTFGIKGIAYVCVNGKAVEANSKTMAYQAHDCRLD